MLLSPRRREIPLANEIHVFFRGKLPGRASLQKAIKAFGFPVSIVDPS